MSAWVTAAGAGFIALASLLAFAWFKMHGASRRALWLGTMLIATQAMALVSVMALALHVKDHKEYVVGAAVLGAACLVANMLLMREVGVSIRADHEASRVHILSEQVTAQERYGSELERERAAADEERERYVGYLARLRDALDEGDLAGARELLREVPQACAPRSDHICVHTALDALLMLKREEARRAGIDVRMQVEIPGELSLEPVEVCAIFANLVDNAIAACSSVERDMRRVSVEAHVAHGYVTCTVRNTYEGEPQAVEPRAVEPVVPQPRMRRHSLHEGGPRVSVPSGKAADGPGVPWHGWGLSIVRELVERNDGALSIERTAGDPSIFRVDAFWRA